MRGAKGRESECESLRVRRSERAIDGLERASERERGTRPHARRTHAHRAWRKALCTHTHTQHAADTANDFTQVCFPDIESDERIAIYVELISTNSKGEGGG
jgi:hypothetical protein